MWLCCIYSYLFHSAFAVFRTLPADQALKKTLITLSILVGAVTTEFNVFTKVRISFFQSYVLAYFWTICCKLALYLSSYGFHSLQPFGHFD